MTDFAAARRNMVDGQVRTADVTDLRLISAMLEVPRERFVPPAMAALAYLDIDVPLGDADAARKMLKPMVLAKLINAAEVRPDERVLVIGGAGGYSAAVLGHLAREVIALEQDATLARRSMEALREQPNVTVVTGELAAGWPTKAPYDLILIDGGTEIVPQGVFDQLVADGRLVCVQGAGPAGKATLFRRSGGEVGSRPIFDASATVLPGFAKSPVFAF